MLLAPHKKKIIRQNKTKQNKTKQNLFCGKIASFNKNSTTTMVIKLRKKGKNEKRDTVEFRK